LPEQPSFSPLPSTIRSELAEGDLRSIIQRRSGQVPVPPPLTEESVALLTYTSGTTGPAKGAVGTHRNVLGVATGYARWQDMAPGMLSSLSHPSSTSPVQWPPR
jgi:long-subunit acyl-CoA synthetase (AMP-forming)